MPSSGLIIWGLLGFANACCWCDSDTAEESKTTQGSDGKVYELVFSDEFNSLSRNFSNGVDSKWTALDAPHFSMVHFKPEQITTVTDDNRNVVRVRATKKTVGNKTYTSGMLQGWNKFCFTGGIVEFSVKFPASPGYWPAVWMFGNLGRAVYEDSCTDVWPWTFDVCSKSLQDSLPVNQRQRIQTCNSTPGTGLNPKQGRGAPEIDIVEGWGGETPPSGNVMQNFQVAPRLPRYFWPRNGNMPSDSGQASWYRGIKYGSSVTPGTWYGHQDEGCNPGTCPDVLGSSIWSTTMGSQYHTVRLEWKVGSDGYIKWYWNDQMTMHIPAKSLTRDYTDPGGQPSAPRQVPNEPMYLMANIALSDHFAGGQKAVKVDPGELMLDWIRVYQDPENVNTGCDPSDYPTQEYIAANQALYGPPVSPMGSCPPERHGLLPRITAIDLGAQGPCDPATGNYTQDLTVAFANNITSPMNLTVNSKQIVLTSEETSPLTITLELHADGLPVNVSARFDGSPVEFVALAKFVAPRDCVIHPTSSSPSSAGSPSSSAPTSSPTRPARAPSSSGGTATGAAAREDTSWSGAMSFGVAIVSAALLVLIVGAAYWWLKRPKRNPQFTLQDPAYATLQ